MNSSSLGNGEFVITNIHQTKRLALFECVGTAKYEISIILAMPVPKSGVSGCLQKFKKSKFKKIYSIIYHCSPSNPVKILSVDVSKLHIFLIEKSLRWGPQQPYIHSCKSKKRAS